MWELYQLASSEIYMFNCCSRASKLLPYHPAPLRQTCTILFRTSFPRACQHLKWMSLPFSNTNRQYKPLCALLDLFAYTCRTCRNLTSLASETPHTLVQETTLQVPPMSMLHNFDASSLVPKKSIRQSA